METLIFSVDIADASQKIVNLKKEINDLKVVQQQQLAAAEQGNEESARQYEQTGAAIKNLGNEQRTYQRLLQGAIATNEKNTDTIKFQNNSIQQNRDLLKQLTAQYIQLKNPSKLATNQIKQLSDELKKQEGAIGDTRRNVGNYADALAGLPGGLGKAVTGVKGFNAALTANPIGAVVMLLSTLFTALQNNAKVADQITFALDGLTKGFQFIIDTVVTTVSSFDNLSNAIRNPIKFIKELASGTAQAAKEGYEASKAYDEFTVIQAKYNQQIQINEKRTEALTKSLKDRTKTEQERIKIANEAADLEIAGFKMKEELAQNELANETLRLKGKEKTAEEEAKLIDLQTKVFIAGEEQKTTAAQRQTRINILLQKEEVRENKEAKIELKKAEIDLAKFTADIKNKEFEDTLKNLKNNTTEQELIVKQAYADGALSREEYEKEIQLIQFESLQNQLVALEDYGMSTIEKENEIQNQLLEQRIKFNEEEVIADKERDRKLQEQREQDLAEQKRITDARIGLAE